jgi:hypothetical protein
LPGETETLASSRPPQLGPKRRRLQASSDDEATSEAPSRKEPRGYPPDKEFERRDDDGRTPLSQAAENEEEAVLKLLKSAKQYIELYIFFYYSVTQEWSP